MLKLVNEDFFLTDVNETTDESTGKVFYHVRLMTNARIDRGSNYKMHNAMLFNITSLHKDYLAHPMLLKHNWNKQGKFFMNGLISDNVKNDALLIGIAFPFTGILKPIPVDPDYRILSYQRLYSDRNNIECTDDENGATMCNKILYLIIAPNTGIFNPKHKNHKESISIPIISYTYNYDKSSNSRKMTVTITKDNVDYTIENEYNIPFVDTQDFCTSKPCILYQPTKQEYEKGRNKKFEQNDKKGTNRKPAMNTEYNSSKKEYTNDNKKIVNTSGQKNKKQTDNTKSESKGTGNKNPKQSNIQKKN